MAPVVALTPIFATLSTRAPLNYSTPFVGSALKQPFFSISNGDITCSPANASFGGSTPPFQLSWQAYPPSSRYNGSFYSPPLEGSLGVYPEAGTAAWNVTAGLPEGSWVRLRVQDGGGAISFDSVREVKNGTAGVDGCSTPEAGRDYWVLAYCFLGIGGAAILLYVYLSASLWIETRRRGPAVAAAAAAEPVAMRQTPQAPPAVQVNEHAVIQGIDREGDQATAGEGAGVEEENPPRYEAQLSGKTAGGL